MANCFFCTRQLSVEPREDPYKNTNLINVRYDCNNCGEYFYVYSSVAPEEPGAENKAKIAAYLCERTLNHRGKIIILNGDYKAILQNPPLPVVTTQEVLDRFPKTLTERFDKALLNLEKRTKFFGDQINIYAQDYPILYALHYEEMVAMINALKEIGYITATIDGIGNCRIVELTPKGFDRIYELRKNKVDSKQAFVAMWFDTSLDTAFTNGFQKAIEEDGKYKAKRIDRAEFLEKIDDKIIAEIRQSKFLVADFTGFRSGVFYEAGFAKGLGIDVIFTCREDYKDKVKDHFDTRQHKHIFWKDEDDLYKQLLNSIKANIV